MMMATDPIGTYRRLPLAPHQMRHRLTRTGDAIVLCHVGVPHLSRDDWSLKIDGLVQRPMVLRLDHLRRYQSCEIASVHQCAGNPMHPLEPTQRVCTTALRYALIPNPYPTSASDEKRDHLANSAAASSATLSAPFGKTPS